MMSRLKILHISDLHFGPPFVEHVGEAVLRQAATLDPGLIVVSGDFTQRAKPEQFQAARHFLDRLPAVPRVVVPGNHDVPLYRVFERLFTPLDLYKEHISPDLDTVTRVEGATVVALDSTAPLRAITNGRIDEPQLDFARRAFADAPDTDLRILVAHHHLAPAPDYESDQIMPRAKAILESLQRSRVDMILGGHLHRAYVGNSLDVHPGVDRDRGIIIVQSGTSTSRRGRAREREKNSFNVITTDAEHVRIVHFMYFDDTDAFIPVSQHTFPRPGLRSLGAGLDLGF